LHSDKYDAFFSQYLQFLVQVNIKIICFTDSNPSDQAWFESLAYLGFWHLRKVKKNGCPNRTSNSKMGMQRYIWEGRHWIQLAQDTE
jgi:hypothetical protein